MKTLKFYCCMIAMLVLLTVLVGCEGMGGGATKVKVIKINPEVGYKVEHGMVVVSLGVTGDSIETRQFFPIREGYTLYFVSIKSVTVGDKFSFSCSDGEKVDVEFNWTAAIEPSMNNLNEIRKLPIVTVGCLGNQESLNQCEAYRLSLEDAPLRTWAVDILRSKMETAISEYDKKGVIANKKKILEDVGKALSEKITLIKTYDLSFHVL